MTKRITKEMLNVANMPDTPTARKVLARMLDDDDIQEYVRPWKGLTEDEVYAISLHMPHADRFEFAQAIEKALKEKNR